MPAGKRLSSLLTTHHEMIQRLTRVFPAPRLNLAMPKGRVANPRNPQSRTHTRCLGINTSKKQRRYERLAATSQVIPHGSRDRVVWWGREVSNNPLEPEGFSETVVIPVVTFLTPLAEHFSDLKDR